MSDDKKHIMFNFDLPSTTVQRRSEKIETNIAMKIFIHRNWQLGIYRMIEKVKNGKKLSQY